MSARRDGSGGGVSGGARAAQDGARYPPAAAHARAGAGAGSAAPRGRARGGGAAFAALFRRGIAPPAGFLAEERAVRSELVRRGPGAAQSAGLGCWDEVAPVFAVGQGLLLATAAAANPIRLNIGVLTGRDPFFDHN